MTISLTHSQSSGTDEILDADPSLLDILGQETALRRGLLPLRRRGAVTVVAAARGTGTGADKGQLEKLFGPVAFKSVDKTRIERQIAGLQRAEMVRRAETSVPQRESCRGMDSGSARLWWGITVFGLIGCAVLAPVGLLQAMLIIALVCLAANSALRATALFAHFRMAEHERDYPELSREALPTVSLLVPLLKEEEIAGRLVKRLSKLTYPADKLDICLVVENDDARTRRTLDRTALPENMRVITVPPGRIRTKPRALNYALPLSKGEIIGIYDAEDAPAPDQIQDVAKALAAHGPEVACVQGVLSFYNARSSWITRCFAIDYAGWFRIMLPGLARLGLVVPLGGTTLFFRRSAIEALNGWDAHNVTEDADLGLRLARRGYRTVLIPSVTEEEATAHAWPWVRQRSRWLKGYALTWLVHMRRPRTLLGELGFWRFVGVQILFLGTILQFALWPTFWTFWVLAFVDDAPPGLAIAGWPLMLLSTFFVLAEVLVMLTGVVAVSARERRWLLPWVPTMIFYYPLGVVAMYKALFEVVANPFYWDKTHHGRNGG